ncbi:MAG: DEAD/DEAH box helicase family protein [Desulfobacteraceae bacterium]|nr:DEAD/DEAH box helicase family protein [Desulfobacteraceae bacterium]
MTAINPKSKFTVGQRWISETEPELGIGTLVFHDKRIIKVHFPLGDCHRQYSRTAAPVKRVVFKIGDKVQPRESKEFCVEKIQEIDGLLFYCQKESCLCETDLCDTMGFSLPQDRLLSGLAGANHTFDLRLSILTQRAAHEKSLVRGFLGGQIDLIAHQFYIAKEITSRALPRVLLSDETGLGKTIEACLILHQLLISHRIQRILIIVPESLVHQWFVELYRKFNQTFRIFNQELCQQIELNDPGANPFSDAQQGICSVDFIQTSEKRKQQILSAGWDMVVMDEAHHILDQHHFYDFMKALGKRTKGLMLLTATPEQMGINTHFSQLQLLDPHRYFDLKTYQAQSLIYGKTAKQVAALIKAKKDPGPLLDTYGPGRVIFRNKRSVIKGFPKRTARLIALKGNCEQIQLINQEYENPNYLPRHGLTKDPRIACLAALAKKIKPEKILVICSSKAKVEAINKALKDHIDINTAKFDETMTLLSRDKNAAWFSREDGARLLICSEIGSEGRNFQFVHHLFLFDLPENPELLEQRIGRVDRIGQKHEIQIHVPFISNSIGEILALWYMKGLNLFEKNINGAHTIFSQFKDRLDHLILETKALGKIPLQAREQLLEKAAHYTAKTQEELNLGKNILLELNSFKPTPARQLIKNIREVDQNPALEQLLESLLAHYGIDMDKNFDTKGEKIIRLCMDRPVDEEFPALPRHTKVITFDRPTAIAREDLGFFNWDHPFVNQAFDFFITKGEGICSTACIREKASPGLFLESIFILECVAPAPLNMERFLSTEPIRILISHLGENHSGKDPFPGFHTRLETDDSDWFLEFEQIKIQLIPQLLSQSKTLAQKKADLIMAAAREQIFQTVGKETKRLIALQKINPNIQKNEIKISQENLKELFDHLSRAKLRLDAVRLIRIKN